MTYISSVQNMHRLCEGEEDKNTVEHTLIQY